MEPVFDRLGEAIADADDLEQVTRPILDLLQAMTGLDSTYLTTIDEVAGLQRILFSRNSREMQIPEGLAVPWGDTLCKRALDENRPFTDDVGACWGDSDAARGLGIRTYISQPVRTVEGDVFGTLCGASAERVAIHPGTIELLGKFARLIAQQLERERSLQAQADAGAQALADPLTGLPNRRGLDLQLRRLRARSGREPEQLLVAVVALDGLPAIGAEHGDAVAERFLIHVARRLTVTVRSGDLVARTGEGEFVALLPEGAAPGLDQRLRSATAGAFRHGATSFDYAGARVGTAGTTVPAGDLDAALRGADAAVQEARVAAVPPATDAMNARPPTQ